MAIKPVTYQGASNFKSNLYALEIKSRFIDQTKANGYYKGYGEELAAIVAGNVVTVRSGALLVQGRLNEIETGGEAVTVTIQNGYVGYILARIETYHPDDTENCTLVARTGATLASIALTQDDTYQRTAESENKVYELPLYSFSMAGGAITNLVKLITAVEENTVTRDIANEAKNIANGAASTAASAVSTANTANSTANTAKSTANTAKSTADTAKATADSAASTAASAVSTANTASTNANAAKATANTASTNASAAVSTANAAKSTADSAASKVNTAIQSAKDIMYPVGSIYMSVKSTSPASLFGGTWSAWGTGRVPVGINTGDSNFNTVEKTGGASTHTLTIDQIPYHNHAIVNQSGTNGYTSNKIEWKNDYGTNGNTTIYYTAGAGGGGAHNNLQPYIVCYMWKRIA
ncbi:MAG: hypothetical protein IKA40_01270 [Clostridia bacterium]|nr:hypothetical protein [Clostridia bacterium]